MKLRFIYFFITAVVVFISASANSEEIWGDLTSNLGDIDLRAVAVDPQNSDIVYCGSSKAIYKSSNGGKIWKQVLAVRGEARAVNFISIHPQDPRLIFAATENGLLKTEDGGVSWRPIFSGIGELERNVRYVALHPQNYDRIYIGTQGGLFYSRDGGNSWGKAGGAVGEKGVAFVAISPAGYNPVYVATTVGVFKSNRERGWERVFVTDSESGESSYDEETFSSPELVNGIAFNYTNPQNLYLATRNGLFTSYDAGSSWSKQLCAGLISDDIRFILSSSRDPRILYAATDRGVFEFSRPLNRWRELYRGITSRDVRFLALDSRKNSLWAATKGGIFKIALTASRGLSKSSFVVSDAKSVLNHFSAEPRIGEIQEVAVKYAEVHPQKIEGWRKGARMKAFLPDFDLDYDKTIYNGTSSRSGSFWVGPRDWSMGLSWNLGDLIWNDDQTSIDTRSKLMVQLRDDILDQVTRLYFERRRLQVEFLISSADNISEQVEKELRLQELTADIDALTGGYFSERLKSKK